jgi:hypothetical protein
MQSGLLAWLRTTVLNVSKHILRWSRIRSRPVNECLRLLLMLMLMLMLLLQARPCARSRERYARRAVVVGKAEDGRVRSGQVG